MPRSVLDCAGALGLVGYAVLLMNCAAAVLSIVGAILAGMPRRPRIILGSLPALNCIIPIMASLLVVWNASKLLGEELAEPNDAERIFNLHGFIFLVSSVGSITALLSSAFFLSSLLWRRAGTNQ